MAEYDVKTDDLLGRLDGSGSDDEWAAVAELREGIGEALPTHLFERYKLARRAPQRASCVYHSTRYARDSKEAVQLGIMAIRDRSKIVRYRACALLAYSLSADALPLLRVALAEAEGETRDDLLAAIDAIEHQNSNYFLDRDHSGKFTFVVN